MSDTYHYDNEHDRKKTRDEEDFKKALDAGVLQRWLITKRNDRKQCKNGVSP